MNFAKKLLIVIFVAMQVSSFYQLHAMERELPLIFEKKRRGSHRIKDYQMFAFGMYKKLQLVADDFTLPVDVVKLISLNTYILHIIVSELAYNLTKFKNDPKTILSVINCLQSSCGLNVSVQALKMGFKQARLSLENINDDADGRDLLELVCVNECNLDRTKILFGATDKDMLQKLLCMNRVSLDNNPLFHDIVISGYSNMVEIILDFFGDKACEIIAYRRYDGPTALGVAKIALEIVNQKDNVDKCHDLNKVIALLESCQYKKKL